MSLLFELLCPRRAMFCSVPPQRINITFATRTRAIAQRGDMMPDDARAAMFMLCEERRAGGYSAQVRADMRAMRRYAQRSAPFCRDIRYRE